VAVILELTRHFEKHCGLRCVRTTEVYRNRLLTTSFPKEPTKDAKGAMAYFRSEALSKGHVDNFSATGSSACTSLRRSTDAFTPSLSFEARTCLICMTSISSPTVKSRSSLALYALIRRCSLLT